MERLSASLSLPWRGVSWSESRLQIFAKIILITIFAFSHVKTMTKGNDDLFQGLQNMTSATLKIEHFFGHRDGALSWLLTIIREGTFFGHDQRCYGHWLALWQVLFISRHKNWGVHEVVKLFTYMFTNIFEIGPYGVCWWYPRVYQSPVRGCNQISCILDPGKDQDTQGISKFHVNPIRIVQSSQYPQIALAKRLLGPQNTPPLNFFFFQLPWIDCVTGHSSNHGYSTKFVHQIVTSRHVFPYELN